LKRLYVDGTAAGPALSLISASSPTAATAKGANCVVKTQELVCRDVAWLFADR
jgi:hypothetical protein